MQLAVRGDAGTEAGQVEVADAVFEAPFNEALVHQVITAYLAGARAGTKAQKTRSDVRGGGAKPWRQKGTGRARAGSIRSPLWRGGGTTFAARPRDYSQKVNRKMYRAAMRSLLAELARSERLVVVESLAATSPRTKPMVEHLGRLGLDDVLIVTDQIDEALWLSVRNLHWAAVVEARDVNPVSLLAFDKVLVTVNALRQLEERVQ
ncbi:MAG: 50S ribosomal protein L4 [Chromatiales bacterium]|nr:50S ribosomal protein L4 [Chromatiales bacterium]